MGKQIVPSCEYRNGKNNWRLHITSFCEEIPQKAKIGISEIPFCDKFSHELQVSLNVTC